MPLDPSILLQSTPFQMPNQLDLAGKGLTLANLANSNQMGNIQVMQAQQQMKMMADPRYSQAVAQMLGGGESQSGNPDFSFLSSYPAAGQAAIEQLLKMRQTAAATEKDTAAAQMDRASTVVKKTNLLASFAANMDPTDQDAKFRLLNGVYSLGMDKLMPPPKIDASPGDWQAYANGVYTMGTDPEKQTQIAVARAKLGPDVAKTLQETLTSQAEENKARVDAGLAPIKVSIERQQANAASLNAATHQAEFLNPSPIIDETSGQVVQPKRTAGPGGYTTSAAPITDAQGNPIQVRPTNAQGSLAKGAGDEVANLQAKAASAAQFKALLQDMAQQDAKGIYSGGVMGSDGAKKMVNILGGLGLLSKEQVAKLANTQVYDAESRQLVADAVSQFAGRTVAARELPFFQETKPSTIQAQQARDSLYDTLYNRSDRVQQQAAQASSYINTPDATGKRPNDLGSFQPKFKEVTMPRASDAMPDPAKFGVGSKLTTPEGVVYKRGIKDGRPAWVNP